MSYYLKILAAISPRGNRYVSKIKKPSKVLVGTPRKGLQSKLDFLADNITNLIGDFDFPDSVNKALHQVQVFHSMHTGGLKPLEMLDAFMTAVKAAQKAAEEITWLHMNKKLPKGVKEEHVIKFTKEVQYLSVKLEVLEEMKNNLKSLAKQATNLGLTLNL